MKSKTFVFRSVRLPVLFYPFCFFPPLFSVLWCFCCCCYCCCCLVVRHTLHVEGVQGDVDVAGVASLFHCGDLELHFAHGGRRDAIVRDHFEGLPAQVERAQIAVLPCGGDLLKLRVGERIVVEHAKVVVPHQSVRTSRRDAKVEQIGVAHVHGRSGDLSGGREVEVRCRIDGGRARSVVIDQSDEGPLAGQQVVRTGGGSADLVIEFQEIVVEVQIELMCSAQCRVLAAEYALGAGDSVRVDGQYDSEVRVVIDVRATRGWEV